MSLLPHNLQIRDVVICDLQLYRTYVRFGRTDLNQSRDDDGLTQSFEQCNGQLLLFATASPKSETTLTKKDEVRCIGIITCSSLEHASGLERPEFSWCGLWKHMSCLFHQQRPPILAFACQEE